MELIYNINFETAGVIYVLVIYAALCIFYSDQSEVNQKFKVNMVAKSAGKIFRSRQ